MRLYKTQYSFRISGNRGYDTNRVRFWVSCPFKQSLDLYIVVDNHEKQTFIMVILSDLINSINQAKPIKKYIYRHVLYLFMSQKDMLTIVRVVC